MLPLRSAVAFNYLLLVRSAICHGRSVGRSVGPKWIDEGDATGWQLDRPGILHENGCWTILPEALNRAYPRTHEKALERNATKNRNVHT